MKFGRFPKRFGKWGRGEEWNKKLPLFWLFSITWAFFFHGTKAFRMMQAQNDFFLPFLPSFLPSLSFKFSSLIQMFSFLRVHIFPPRFFFPFLVFSPFLSVSLPHTISIFFCFLCPVAERLFTLFKSPYLLPVLLFALFPLQLSNS